MSAFDTGSESEDSQTLQSQRIWKAAGKQDLDFDSQRLRNRLRAKMFGVDASPVTIGRFVVLETVGSGGMGVVYAAYDEELDRRVAVKLLRSSREDEDETVGKGRLQREAQALAKLSHPNVVQVYEVGTFDDRVFLAMEFLSGPDLRTWLLEESRPWREVLRHFVEAGEGLWAAHREGIIHRDFKPANVLFGGDGRVRVVDFGLARSFEHAKLNAPVPTGELKERALSVELTQTGEIMGTPAYMSPEQARYEGVDARSDQYSFCVALYEALFGRRPHAGRSTPEVLVSVAEGEVVPPPRNTKVPTRVVRAIMRGLRPDPADRFPSMEALLARLSLEERGRWRWIGGGGVLVVGGLAALMLAGQNDCPSFATDLNEAWGPQRRSAVQAAFVRSGAQQASEVLDRVNRRLDTYASDWLDARQDACEAHRVRQEQSAQLHDQRVACLLEREVELETLTRVFSEADARIVEQAPRAVTELSPLEECGDFDRMIAAAEIPVSNDLRTGLAKVRAEYKAGLYDRALAGIEVVLKGARAEGVRRVEAQARLQEGLIQERRREYGSAAEAVEEAIDLAEAAADDDIAARAWSRLTRYQAELGEAELAQRSVRRARAKVRRLDDEPGLLLDVNESRALAAWQAQRYEDAIGDQTEVVAQHHQQHGVDDPRTADAERRLANMLSDMGRHVEAQVRYQNTRDVFAQAYGPGHPMVALVVVETAIDHRAAGRVEDARQTFLEAERLFVAALGDDAPALVRVHLSLGDIALAQDDMGEAKRRADKLSALIQTSNVSALDRAGVLALKGQVAERRGMGAEMIEAFTEYLVVTESLEGHLISRAIVRINMIGRLIEFERYREAQEQLKRSMSELDRIDSDDLGPEVLAALQSNALLFQGLCAEALREPSLGFFERAMKLWSNREPSDDDGRLSRARVQWAIARQLQADAPARALELAEQALEHLQDDERAAAREWIAERGGSVVLEP